MPFRAWKCEACDVLFTTKKDAPVHCEGSKAVQVMTSPLTKFMEKIDPDRSKLAIVGQETMLRERARKHSRDVEMDDLIMMNEKDTAFQNGWLKTDGTKRKKIDDV